MEKTAKQRDRRGFTLIELMVVVAIVGLLAVVGMATFTNVMPGARDARRLADMRDIRTALENYYSDQNYYPPYNNNSNYGWYYSTSLDWIPASPSFSGSGRYMERVPQDPRDAGWWCTRYRYYRVGCCRYYLEYNLEARDDQKALGRYQSYNGTCRRYLYRITSG